jgi:hypothetical protein
VGDDVVLQAGDRCVVPAGSHVVMEAWPVSAGEAPVRFDWIDLPRPASAPSRFQQEVAMPLRASIGALGEALAAGGRSLGLLIVALWGILRYGEFFIPRRGQVLSALESCRS